MICRVVLLLAGLVALTTGLRRVGDTGGRFPVPALRRGLPWRTGTAGSQFALSQPSFRSMFQRGALSGPISGLRSPLRSSGSAFRTIPSGLGTRRIGGAVSIQRLGASRSLGQIRRPSIGGLTSLRQPIRSRLISPLSRGTPVGLRRRFDPRMRSRSDLLAMLRRSYGSRASNIQIRTSRNGIPIIRIPVRRNTISTPVSRRIAQAQSTSRSASVVDTHTPRPLDQIFAIFSTDAHNDTDSLAGLLPQLTETISHASKVERITHTVKTKNESAIEPKETHEISDKALSKVDAGLDLTVKTEVADLDKVTINGKEIPDMVSVPQAEPVIHATESKVVESAVVATEVILPDAPVKTDVIIPEKVEKGDVIIPETPVKTDVIVDTFVPLVEKGAVVATDVIAKDIVPVGKIKPIVDSVTSHPLDVIVDATEVIAIVEHAPETAKGTAVH